MSKTKPEEKEPETPAQNGVSLSELRSKSTPKSKPSGKGGRKGVAGKVSQSELVATVKEAAQSLDGQVYDQQVLTDSLRVLVKRHKVLPKRLLPLQKLILAEISQPITAGNYFVLDLQTTHRHEIIVSPADKEDVLVTFREKIDVKELEAWAEVCDWTRVRVASIWHRLENRVVPIYLLVCSPWHVREGIDVAAYRTEFTPEDVQEVLSHVGRQMVLEVAWIAAQALSERDSLKASIATSFVAGVRFGYMKAGQVLSLDEAGEKSLAKIKEEIPRMDRLKMWVKGNWKLLAIFLFIIISLGVAAIFGFSILLRILLGG